MAKKTIGNVGIYDARELGTGKMLLLGMQHLFAMFGATVLVPALTGLSVSATLLFAGVGTLLFHLLTKGKVPAFLGSSFAFLGGYFAISSIAKDAGNINFIPYASAGVACAGLLYVVLSALIKGFGTKKVMKFFPPIVTAPIIIAIGLTLANSAIDNCNANWLIALIAILTVVSFNIWGKGMAKIIPIFLGVLMSCVAAVIFQFLGFEIFDPAKIELIKTADWIGIPFSTHDTVFSLVENCNTSLLITSIITIMPIALATMVEHIGDICAISSTVGKNYIQDPGLQRTLLGDGFATTLAALFGAPANTTYGENTGVLALSKVYDPKVIRIAAYFAIFFSFCPKFAAVVSAMPTATIGGVSLILYGMISAVGVRNIVENQVDFTKSRNVIIAALILGLALGITFSSSGAISFPIGNITISLSGLAVAALVGIIVNMVLPGKDYEFGSNDQGDKSVDFKV